MSENVTALHLVLSRDPALFAIVRLSLLVSLSVRRPDRGAVWRADRAYPLSRQGAGHCRAKRPDGLAPSGCGAGGLPDAFALRTPWIVRPPVYAGRRGDADVVFVHAKSEELKFLAEGESLQRFPVMYNDFVLIGPKSDPARVRGMKDVGEALRAIKDKR